MHGRNGEPIFQPALKHDGTYQAYLCCRWVCAHPAWLHIRFSRHHAPYLEQNNKRAKGHVSLEIIKRVVASEGDEICRENLVISVNDTAIAEALETDFYGEKLPSWSGCRKLKANQYFLINNHPHSLDGRYFGPEQASDLAGSARLIWTES